MNTITILSKLLREKKLSSSELTKLYLDAVKEYNPKINAYISLTEETALACAAEADRRLQSGENLTPLTGIPFILKDNIVTKGLKTTCASKTLENHVPVYDASVWEYLKNDGAVLLGKGNMDEFAMGSTGETSYYGAARNPHNTEHVAGGSSSGSAAAVAAGIAAFGIGSDTGGSIRQPASFCGIVGLKPTYGAVSRSGLIAFASSLDQIGPLTLSVRDAAIVYDAICRQDSRDMTSRGGVPISRKLTENIRGVKLGIAREFYENLPADVGRVMEQTLNVFESMGAILTDIEFPLLRHSLSAYYVLACAEASSNLGRYDGLRFGHRAAKAENMDDFFCTTRSEGFGAEVRRRILLGTRVLSAGYYDAYYNKAALLKNAVRNEYKKIFTGCDCLVTPTVPVTAFKHGAGQNALAYQSDICTVSINIAGLPAISIPCGLGDTGLPVGLQLIGDKFREDIILGAALAFESETVFEKLQMGVRL